MEERLHGEVFDLHLLQLGFNNLLYGSALGRAVHFLLINLATGPIIYPHS